MEISTIGAVVSCVSAVMNIVKAISDGRIRIKDRITEREIELIKEFSRISELVRSLAEFFNDISIAAGQVHILTNKITEIITSKEAVLKGDDGEKKDHQWEIITMQLNNLDSPVKDVQSISRRNPLQSSRRMGEIGSLSEQLSKKHDIAMANCLSKDFNLLRNTCTDASRLGNEIKALALSSFHELMNSYIY